MASSPCRIEKSLRTEEHERLCRRLRELRETAGLSQTALAGMLGKSQSFVTKYETGERRLDLLQVREICRALGIKLSKLAAEFD